MCMLSASRRLLLRMHREDRHHICVTIQRNRRQLWIAATPRQYHERISSNGLHEMSSSPRLTAYNRPQPPVPRTSARCPSPSESSPLRLRGIVAFWNQNNQVRTVIGIRMHCIDAQKAAKVRHCYVFLRHGYCRNESSEFFCSQLSRVD